MKPGVKRLAPLNRHPVNREKRRIIMRVWMKAKRLYTAFLVTAIAVFAFTVFMVGSPWAAQEKEGNETYTGQVQKDGNVISVKLTIKYPLTPGKEGAILIYGGKRMCTCQGTYEGEVDNKKVFSLLSKDGGAFCDKLDKLEVTQVSSDDLSYTTSSLDKKTLEEGKLSRLIK